MDERKVAIIGDGAVGSSCAYTLMLGHAVNEIVIVDLNIDKAEGDALDMADGMSFLSVPKVVRAGGYEAIKGSRIIIITAGAAQKVGETRIDLMKKNAAIFDSIISSIKPYVGPDTIVLVVSNPVDILTYYTFKKLSIPASHVFGSGTVLDTSRLKRAISVDTGIDPRSVHTFVVGEHGDSEVALWSSTSVGGLSLTEYCAKCGKCHERNMTRLNALHEKVKNAAYEIIKKKGATNYAIALAVQRIVSAILNDENSVLTVSSYINSELDGAIKNIYLSLPCVVGKDGIKTILRPNLSEEERSALILGADSLSSKLKELPL